GGLSSELALAELNSQLADTAFDVQAILTAATSILSRLRPATWVAVVMSPNPEKSRVVVGDDAERAMADYVEAYVAAIDRPNYAPTTGLSQQVIESGRPIL